MDILGSVEWRSMGGVSIAHARPAPRLRIGHTHGQFVIEGYYMRSFAQGIRVGRRPEPYNESDVLGGLAYVRYQLSGPHKDIGVYLDAGIGLHFSSRRTRDLESIINSTPMLGAGLVFNKGPHEILLGLRYLHVSNGGTVGHNRGQNGLYLMVSFRF